MDNATISQGKMPNGYGMFWIANSITSTLLESSNHKLKDDARVRDEEFQREMRHAQEITDDKRMQEEYAFKRRLLDLSRQHRSEQVAIQFNNQMRIIELEQFIASSWPLDPQLLHVFLDEIEKGGNRQYPKLNVILLHSPLLPPKYGIANKSDAELYMEIEEDIINDDVPYIGNIDYRKDAAFKNSETCTADISSGNHRIMNIHFWMRSLPTLVISPTYTNDGLMHFTGAVWEPQTARPMIRPLFSINYDIYEMGRSEEYRTLMIDKFHASVSVITGSVRDSYMMLTQGKTPTLSHWLNDNKHSEIKRIAAEDLGIKMFVNNEKNNIIASLDERNTPKLLEAYSKAEIDNIRELVKSFNL